MELELQYSSMAEVPQGFESLYTEKDGKAVLTGVKGVSGFAAEKATLTKSLNAEREAHKATKAKLNEINTQVETLTTERDELQIKVESGGKPDDGKIAELVERRVKLATGPLEKKVQAAESRASELESKLGEATQTIRSGKINSAIQEAANKAGIDPKMMTAAVRLLSSELDIDDTGNIIAREGGMFTPGLDLGGVLNEAKQHFPNLWPLSQGGGAKGAGGLPDGQKNPFTYKDWNMTEQFSLMAKDKPLAERLAKAAGVDLARPKRPEPPKA